MRRILALLLSLFSTFSLFAKDAYLECPNFDGFWTCELFTNGGKEPIYESFRASHQQISKTHFQYDIGGEKFEAKWDIETELPVPPGSDHKNVKVRCLDERTLLFWYEKNAKSYQNTVQRIAADRMRSDQISLRPEHGDNNIVTRLCIPAKPWNR